MNIFFAHVDMIEEIIPHVEMEAGRMSGGDADVLIEIESDDARKIERLFAMQAN